MEMPSFWLLQLWVTVRESRIKGFFPVPVCCSLLTEGMLPGLHVNTCASSDRGQTGLSPGAHNSILWNQKQTVVLTLLASGGGLPPTGTSAGGNVLHRLQVWTQHLSPSNRTWDRYVEPFHMTNYTRQLLAFKYKHNAISKWPNIHHSRSISLLQLFQNFLLIYSDILSSCVVPAITLNMPSCALKYILEY